ncbi:ABC transporter permease [Brevibacillus formosus]|uniref:ABC transporter permease n=1 Tax=Brevibacillus formosus TaxID=54913 RepID=A0A220MHJ4_9BACL|nr:TIGR02206 family membrane protein [Brevibacillus formosus]ASJ54534.1 ABC transporter permease [Brevibacillus formosus]
MTSSYFSLVLTGEPFRLFSPSHVITLILVLCLVVLTYLFRQKLQVPTNRLATRYGLMGVLLLSEVCYQLWHVYTGSWTAAYTLPLQLCSVTLLLSAVMLMTRSYGLYEITFFAGIGGAMQALLTPELFYPFPHFRFVHFFVAHAGIVLACLYMTWVEGYRPTVRSIWKTMGFLNLLLLVALFVNQWTGGNYLFVSRKPDNPSLIDFLGPYPWYIASLEGVAIALFFLLYLPFVRKQPLAKEVRSDLSV